MDAPEAGRLLSCSDADGFNPIPVSKGESAMHHRFGFVLSRIASAILCPHNVTVHDRNDFRPRLRRETRTTGGRMKKAIFSTILKISRLAILSLVLAVNASAFAQKKQAAKGAEPQGRLVLAINEGAAGSLTAMDVVFRYEEFKPVVENALGAPVTLAEVRNAKA